MSCIKLSLIRTEVSPGRLGPRITLYGYLLFFSVNSCISEYFELYNIFELYIILQGRKAPEVKAKLYKNTEVRYNNCFILQNIR